MPKEIWHGHEVLWRPNAGPQTAFLASPAREVFYGGAAAGGKSDAIIAGAARFADHPLHRAILFRRTRPQLQEVIDRTRVLYPEIIPGAYWIERESRWYLPAGGHIQMGYAEHEDDMLGFKTFEYNYIGFDELTSFTEKMYVFMFSRNRSKSRDLPLQVRSASNPGDVGHEWVARRFIINRKEYQIYEEKEQVTVGGKPYDISITRQFIPAKITDNPKLPDPEGYIAGLKQMGEDGDMYLHGVWVRPQGGKMFRQQPKVVEPKPEWRDYYMLMCMDYGLTDNTAIYWLMVYDNGVVDVVKELYINETSLDDIADRIKDTEAILGLRAPVIRVGDPKMFTRESNMQSIATLLADKGIMLQRANNDRFAGWVQMQRFLYRNQLRVWDGEAPDLLRTLPNLMKHPTKPNDIKDKQEDHAADSLRYGLMAVYENLAGDAASRRTDAPKTDNQDVWFDKLRADTQRQRDPYEELEW